MPFHSGEVGLAYASVTLGAKGGVAPYSWSLASGALPPGLSLGGGGVVSGSVNTPGTYSFSVQVSDSAGGSATGKSSVTVYSALAMTETCAGKCVVGKGCSKCGTFGTVSRGLAPYSYKIVGGAIPKGMTWSGLVLKGGFPAGNYAMSVQVTDKLGAHVTVDANWSIYSPAILARGRTSDCISHSAAPACTTVGWTYSGGNPSVAPKVVILGYSQYQAYTVPTSPPPGWSVSVKNGVITFSAGGIQCNAVPSNWDGYISLELIDLSACATTSPSNKATLLVDISNNC